MESKRRSQVCPATFPRSIGVALFITTVAVGAPAEILRLEPPCLSLGVDPASGQIVELREATSQQNLVQPAPTSGGLWEIEFASPLASLSPANAQTSTVTALATNESGWRVTWGRFGLPDAPELKVEVTCRLGADQGSSRWHIAVKHLGQRTIARLRFPRLLGLSRLAQERLVVPFWIGLLASEPRGLFGSSAGTASRREFDYPGHASLQCMSFYTEGGPGIYLACDDTAGYRKLFAAFSQGTPDFPSEDRPPSERLPQRSAASPDLNLEIVHLVEQAGSSTQDYQLPYAAIVTTFRGDWFDAAARYRSWATNQPWATQSRWKQGTVPRWIGDTALWLWNRGRSPGVIEPALALQSEVRLPLSVFWHWWHGCAYDTGFPEYLPPREGAASFTTALIRAHAQDVHALVYMNQRLWGMTTASWTNENAAAFAVKNPDGTITPEVYNRFTRLPCATMCLATDFWRQKYARIATQAFLQLGVDGIYMDQACSSLACYDPVHQHPLGGGTYWMRGFQALAADLRRQCAGSDRGGVALAGEGCAENWLPYLDLMLALDVSRERYAGPDGWDPIPFFQAVYHGYAVFYGSYSSLTLPPYDDLWPPEFAPKEPLKLLNRRFSRQFCLEQARAFVWGQQPTLANFLPSHLRERPEEVGCVLHLARLRRLALKYLQDGTMLPPPSVQVPSEPTPLSRLSIYAGQQETLKEFTKTFPLVLASAWEAPDGDVALALASVADRPLTATLVLRLDAYDRLRGARLVPVEPDAPAPSATWSEHSVSVDCHLARFAAQVYELKRN